MKVLFTTNIPSPYRVDFFNELGKYCDLTVIFENAAAKDRDNKWKPDAFKNFNAVFLKGLRVGAAEAFCPKVIKYIKDKSYDVIVIGMYSTPTGMLAVQYLRNHSIPFIISSDGGMAKADSGVKYKIKKHFISSADGWLSTGKITSEYLQHYGADADKIYVYPFTSVSRNDIIAQPLSLENKQKYRDELDIKEEFIFLSVGQFIYRKGYDVLLNASKDINKNIGIYVVGGKPTEEYECLIKQFNLNNVHFIDFMSKRELSRYYKASDIFVLPTREDIWGLVINEAMSYGLPVITTDKCVAGIEMVHDGLNGFIIPADNIDALKSSLNKAVNYKFDSNISLKTAREYSIENMVQKHMDVFDKFIKCRM